MNPQKPEKQFILIKKSGDGPKRSVPIVKIQKPKIQPSLLEADRFPLDKTAENLCFTERSFSAEPFQNTSWDGCRIEKSNFSNCRLSESKFFDTVFTHCNFSGARLDVCNFFRVLFFDCNFSGADFSSCMFHNVSFQQDKAPSANFSQSTFSGVEIMDMQCKSSFWESCKLQKTMFTHVDFTDASFYRTALAGIDASSCKLTGLKLNPEDIRGAKMNADQAMEFIRLLGIQIL